MGRDSEIRQISGVYLIGQSADEPPQPRTVEVCRSFSYRLNLKNPDGSPTYESCDFFASRKMSCSLADAEWVSQQIFEECVEEVRDSIKAFQAQRRRGPNSENRRTA